MNEGGKFKPGLVIGSLVVLIPLCLCLTVIAAALLR